MSLTITAAAIALLAIAASWLVARWVGWGKVAMFWMFYILIILALLGTWIDLHRPE